MEALLEARTRMLEHGLGFRRCEAGYFYSAEGPIGTFDGRYKTVNALR